MSVRIGHASISESGSINGSKGDSTGREVCIRDWYNKPWDFMAIHPDAGVREKHAAAIEAACNNDNIGYGQADRNTLYALAKNVDFDLSRVGRCNCDCSSLQNVAAVASGAPGVSYGSNGWTTSVMRNYLRNAGYKIIEGAYTANAEYCVRGAIYVNAGSHTVCGLDNGSNADQTLSAAGIGGQAPSNEENTSYAGKGIGTATAKMSMNVRSGAGTNYGSVGGVSSGKSVEVLEALSNGWYKIVWPGASCGYAYTSNAGDKYYTYEPKASAPTPAPSQGGNTSLKVAAARSKDSSLAGAYKTTTALNMRAVPGVLESNNVVVVLPAGATVRNYGYYTEVNGAKWLYLSYNGKIGFSNIKYLEKQ